MKFTENDINRRYDSDYQTYEHYFSDLINRRITINKRIYIVISMIHITEFRYSQDLPADSPLLPKAAWNFWSDIQSEKSVRFLINLRSMQDFIKNNLL